MILNTKQIELITNIDSKVKTILANGGDDKAICIAMLEQMPKIKTIISSVSHNELNIYLNKYDGFYYYIKLLETIAQGIKDGTIQVP